MDEVMESRGQKRSEMGEELPADKRACSSLECRASSSTSPPQTLANSSSTPLQINEKDMETSSSASVSGQSGGDAERDSPYGSCDSDDYDESDHGHGILREVQRRRSHGDEGKIKMILLNLNEGADSSTQLASLTELCEVLSFTVQDSISSLTADQLASVLVRLSKHEFSPDIMLFAIRAITYLCDVYPKASAFLLRHQAVDALCQRLMAIEYMDVAEQCLQALEKISRDQPLACLQSGAVVAVLGYIDFFPTSTQRTALLTVVNICKKLSADCLTPIMEAIPRFIDLLQYEDQQLIESVATCLIKIADRVKGSPDMLNGLCKHELIHRITHLIASSSRTTLSQATYNGLIGFLAQLAAESSDAVKVLFELEIGTVIKDVLANSDLSHVLYPHVVEQKSSQVHEIMRLLNEILPPAVKDHEDQLLSSKGTILMDRPEILLKFGMNVLPILIQIVNSGANSYVSYGCLCIINKLVHISKPEILLEMVNSSKITSFLMGVFTQKDGHILTLALQITERVLQKLSDCLMASFAKEGVLYAIDALVTPEKCSQFIFFASNNIQHNEIEAKRCLCYAYSSTEFVSESKTCKLSEESVQDVAKRIRMNYFSSEFKSMDSIVTNVLQNLRTISAELTSLVNVSFSSREFTYHEERFHSLLRQVMIQIGGEETTSTFEIIESGLIKALVNYLSDGLYNGDKANLHCGMTTHFLDIIHKRFEMFARVASLSSSESESRAYSLLLLVRKLQSALSTVESFPVVVGTMAKIRGSYALIPHGRRTGHPCLRVCFKMAEGETSLHEYSNDVTTVDPFCSLEAIEKFLQPLVVKKRVEIMEHASTHSQGLTNSVPIQAGLENGCISPVPMELDRTCSASHDVQADNNVITHQNATELTHLSGLDLNGARSSGEAYTRADEEPKPFDSSGPGAAGENLGNASFSGSPSSMHDAQSQSSSAEDGLSGLSFYLEGIELNKSSTLYQEIIRMKSQDELCNCAKLWSEVYTLTFKRAAENNNCSVSGSAHKVESSAPDRTAQIQKYFPLFPSIIFSPLVPHLEKSSPTSDILFLLKSLETMNRFASHLVLHGGVDMYAKGKCNDLVKPEALVATLSPLEFVNSKLSAKLEQQMRELLTVSTGAMPLWCNSLMSTCPFIFSFEARLKYFQLAAFGRRNAEPQVSANSDSGATPTERRLGNGSLPRQKFMVSRDRILESATQMMESLTCQKVVLEVQYSDEVGTGLGPTLEFYTLVSHEFQKPGLNMWRSDYKYSAHGKSIEVLDSGMIVTSIGLFPRPSNETEITDVAKKFLLLGQIVAKAIQDGRVLDIPFSRAFYKLMIGKELTIYDIQSFDPELGRTLLEFHAISSRKKMVESVCEKDDLSFRGTRVEDLVLDFTVPGFPEYVLTPGSDQPLVTVDNLEEYVSLVLDATLYTGISRQLEAFRSGFNKVFPIEHLQIFTEDELERLLCGERDTWVSSELLDHIKLDHGYTSSSPAIIHLLEIIQDLDYEQRRAFLQFITGAPRLPPGGLAALNPKLTIVRKHSSNSPDADLPSVMTCANYLKLPSYSSKEVMKEKLLYAIIEGQGSFHLS